MRRATGNLKAKTIIWNEILVLVRNSAFFCVHGRCLRAGSAARDRGGSGLLQLKVRGHGRIGISETLPARSLPMEGYGQPFGSIKDFRCAKYFDTEKYAHA
jgi:hypothetical protein